MKRPDVLQRKAAWLILLLVVAAAAGCLRTGGQDTEVPATTDLSGPEGVPADHVVGMDAQAVGPDRPAPSPTWEVGQWWTWEHTTGTSTFEWTMVVIEDEGDAWRVASDDPEPARRNAIFDWYVFGDMSKDQITDQTAGGLVFYDFPLTDGKRWESTFGTGDDAFQVVHEATFNPAIETFQGPEPGFEITAVTNGSLFFEYDYVPALGWFSTLRNYLLPHQTDDGQQAVDWTYRVTDAGATYQGQVYDPTAELLVEAFHEVDATPGQTDATPAPHASFEVSQDASALFGVAGAYAEAGVSQATLLDPEGDHHTLSAASPTLDGDVAAMAHIMDPVPGAWQVLMGGAGMDTEGWVTVWQLFDEVRTL